MNFVIEPRNMSCVYQNDPYVGRGLTARWFVFDEETGATLANNDGKGYATYQKAFLAYQWQLKGLPAIKIHKMEQEMLYDWSLKNKLLTDKLDRIVMIYEQEGKDLTPKHIVVFFDTNHTRCPTEPKKFLEAYKNDFYKDVILQRREQRAKKEEFQKKWNLKRKIATYADNNKIISKIRRQADIMSVLLEPVKTKIQDHMKDYEERPQSADAVATARVLSYVSPVTTIKEGTGFPRHEWEIIPIDPKVHPMYDTFGQEDPSSINRVMSRAYTTVPDTALYHTADTIVDPITYQIVQRGTPRCTTSQEWQQMAGKPKKKKKRQAPTQNTKEWVAVPEEQKAKTSSTPKVRPAIEQTSPNVQMGKKKGQRIRPEGLPPKKAPPKKPPIKDRVQAKIHTFKEEWTYEDDDYDEEQYEIPTIGEAFAQMKNSIKTFFADVKNEADKQKVDEQAAKEERKKARVEKKAARQQEKTSEPEVVEPPAEDFINSIVPDITLDTASDDSQNSEELLDELLEEFALDEQNPAHE